MGRGEEENGRREEGGWEGEIEDRSEEKGEGRGKE